MFVYYSYANEICRKYTQRVRHMATDYQLMLSSLQILAARGIEIEPFVGQAYLSLDNIDHQVYEDGNALQFEYMVTKVAEMMLFFAEGSPRSEAELL